MTQISCDLCTRTLVVGKDARYAVTIEARLVCEPTECSAVPSAHPDDDEPETDTDHISAMDELLADLPDADDETVDEADELPVAVAPMARCFDLCGRCYGKFAGDPFGHTRHRGLTFSTN